MKKIVKLTTVFCLFITMFIFNSIPSQAENNESNIEVEYETVNELEEAKKVLNSFYQHKKNYTFFDENNNVINDKILSKKDLYLEDKDKHALSIYHLIASFDEVIDNPILPYSVVPDGGSGSSGTYLTKTLKKTVILPVGRTPSMGTVEFTMNTSIKVDKYVTWIDPNPNITKGSVKYYDGYSYANGDNLLATYDSFTMCKGCDDSSGTWHYSIWFKQSAYTPKYPMFGTSNELTYVNMCIYARDNQWFDSYAEFVG